MKNIKKAAQALVVAVIAFAIVTLIVTSGDDTAAPITLNIAATTTKAEEEYVDFYGVFPVGAEAEGNIIKAIQKSLNENGYPVEPTGVFDAATGMAVKNFQLDNGLECDGIVGATTRVALNVEAKESFRYTANLRRIAAESLIDIIIYVNCGEDPHVSVYHFTDNGWKAILQTPAVIGAATDAENVTPLGIHKVWYAGDEAFLKGGKHYFFPVFYTLNGEESSYGIHSVAYTPDDKVWESSVLDRAVAPTGRLTDGCVRIDQVDAQHIQRVAPGAIIIVDDRDFVDVYRSLTSPR